MVTNKIQGSFAKTGIRDFNVIEETENYIVQINCGLDCKQLEKISHWILKTFGGEGRFSHLIPKMGVKNNIMSILISKALTKQFN